VKLGAKAIAQNVSGRTGKRSVGYVDDFLDQIERTAK